LASIEIHSIQSVSGNQPRIRRMAEKAGQTFLAGTPVLIELASGFLIAAAASGSLTGGATISLAGFSKDFGANLATSGVAQQQTFGSVPNESSAVNIARPYFNDGQSGFEVAAPDTVFLAQVGPSQTVVQANVGNQYGMTKDTDNHWYVDLTRSTPGTNTICTIVKIDPNDQSATPRGVYITILPAVAQQVV
jgi:hypothetical protein